MYSTYKEFLEAIQTTHIAEETYYKALVQFKDNILLDIAKTNQGVVARRLRIHKTKLGPILNILKLNIQLVPSQEPQEPHHD